MAHGNQNLPDIEASAPTLNVVNNVSSNYCQQIVLHAINNTSHASTPHAMTMHANNVANNVYNVNVDPDQAYFDSFPPGYRFCPLDNELILYYLKRKILEQPLPLNRIRDVNIYLHNPDELARRFPSVGENQWYFFTPRDKKYRNGKRPNRAAGSGYWKATGSDKPISDRGIHVGDKKALVFYEGKPPHGLKTDWIMHEYTIKNGIPTVKRSANDMRLDDYVLCKIYKNKSSSHGHEVANLPVQVDERAKDNSAAFDPPSTRSEVQHGYFYPPPTRSELQHGYFYPPGDVQPPSQSTIPNPYIQPPSQPTIPNPYIQQPSQSTIPTIPNMEAHGSWMDFDYTHANSTDPFLDLSNYFSHSPSGDI